MKILGMDLIAIFFFAFLARAAHGGVDITAIFNTFWPFALGTLLGWLISNRGKNGVLIWLCTAITGLIIWGIRHSAFPHWSFIIVATTMSGFLLLGWRGVALLVHRRAQ
ncbi:putative integral membrane protein [Corynebacterium kutscheri]|uniref:Integral membrane protein n=1 Tax=Corynebacterium kutscheri TaxID=35755 RepID=A0A0F6R390_9CORY|nr:DUF3054 domain-containing protein [Corynebacterium kutscheri]AKE42118.1 Protein of unknown function (DUF3054) [Corynebacterium kutscheri]VEH05945.1 putative integral membrane protein [Corynebacterium kutscheri]VEH10461.1 putative integral membrane protein [Corynebacterium kutscheri]VEH81834.1 putative integral membrane protein [Corynebacterium kutscheri]